MVFCTSTITAAEGSTAGERLDGQHGLKEVAALPAVLFRDLDAHQAQFEHFAQQVLAEDAGFVHLAHVRADAFARKTADGVLKHLLFFAQHA